MSSYGSTKARPEVGDSLTDDGPNDQHGEEARRGLRPLRFSVAMVACRWERTYARRSGETLLTSRPGGGRFSH